MQNNPEGLNPERVAVETVDVWTFRIESPLATTDLTGYSVEANDGKIGKVDESGGGYLIVDTGPWIFGKKVMLPAGVVEHVDPDTETVFVSRTKDEIKSAPEYDPERGPLDDSYRQSLGSYYGNR
jgi:hypothetical protein